MNIGEALIDDHHGDYHGKQPDRLFHSGQDDLPPRCLLGVKVERGKGVFLGLHGQVGVTSHLGSR